MKPQDLFPAGRFEALLFDCDGTIADSMPVHLKAWNLALARRGAKLSEADHDRWAGVPTPQIVELLNKEYGHVMPVAEVTAEKEKTYLQLIETVGAVDEIRATIDYFYGRLPLAVVSGSPHASVLKTIAHLGLEKKFAALLGCDDYDRGKPAPDCYLKAAKILQVSPERCLVFEDGELGIQAAIAARMKWIRVTPSRGGLDLKNSDYL